MWLLLSDMPGLVSLLCTWRYYSNDSKIRHFLLSHKNDTPVFSQQYDMAQIWHGVSLPSVPFVTCLYVHCCLVFFQAQTMVHIKSWMNHASLKWLREELQLFFLVIFIPSEWSFSLLFVTDPECELGSASNSFVHTASFYPSILLSKEWTITLLPVAVFLFLPCLCWLQMELY